MQVIYSCLVIVMFVTGTVFGFTVGKNGYIQMGTSRPEVEKPMKKTVEQQLDDMMNYDGKVKKGDKK